MVVAEPLRPVGVLARQPRAALESERVELVPRVAVGELHRPNRGQHPPGVIRDRVHGAERVLAAVPGAYATAEAGLVAGDEARPVQRRAALDLVPEVDHRVRVRVRRLDGEAREVDVPVVAQSLESGRDLGRTRVPGHDSTDLRRPTRRTHDEDDPALLARREIEVVGERADAVATRRMGVGWNARLHDDRVGQIPAAADEVLAVAGVAGRGFAAAEEVGQWIELGPDSDHAFFAVAEYDVLGPVQVRHVADCVGQAELNVAERPQVPRRRASVPDRHDPQLAGGRLID